MHEVPAGVAQLAEQPSCKRATEGRLSCGLIDRLAGFGTYSAHATPSRGGPGKAVIEAVIVHRATRGGRALATSAGSDLRGRSANTLSNNADQRSPASATVREPREHDPRNHR